MGLGGSNSSSRSSLKRAKRGSWNEKKRAGMSFLIVIAFFAVFALIILTEILMIDEKNKGQSGGMRYGSLNRFGESIPDYDDVKEEYSIEEAVFMRNNRLIREMKRNGRNEQSALPVPVAQEPIESHNPALAISWGSLLPSSMERTLPTYPLDMKPTDGSWQIVNGTRFKFFVFSAFYDRRGGRLIRIIGATKTRGPEKVWCRFWYPIGNSTHPKYRSSSVMARVKIIRENWNLKYSACFVLCPVTAPGLAIPYAVSVISKIRSPPGNVLLVRNTDDDADLINTTNFDFIPEKIGVCVKPLHFDYDSALYLLEFLEMNTLLGISHFTFYNHTLGPRASCVLRHYMNDSFMTNFASNNYINASNYSRGGNNGGHNTILNPPRATVTMLPWDLRMRSQKDIRTEGLFAALNDCLYRNMYRYQYVALIDLDEFIIPRYNDTLIDLINSVNSQWISKRVSGRNTGAYSFQNAFFYLQFADDVLMYSNEQTSNAALRASLITQRKTRRRAKLHPQKQRSKYICKPDAVVEAGNHFVWEFITGRIALSVPADAGILHHYRVCEFGGDDCVKTPSLVDRMAHKYSDRLVQRVEAIYNQLKVPCNLLDLPPVPTRPATIHKKIINLKSALAQQQQAAIDAEAAAAAAGAAAAAAAGAGAAAAAAAGANAGAGAAAAADGGIVIQPVNGQNSVYDSNKNRIKVI